MVKKKNKKKNIKQKRRFLLFGVTSIVIILSMSFTMAKYWIEIIDKHNERKLLEAELLTLKEKEKELQLDANKLQDPEYIARYARQKYLYSKDGEFVLKIPEDE